ncbi:primosomal protein N' [Vogesella sp. GCM10023246]|uniref:Replication restart protein PriA n=1 Tax=Vogesella oryzagri TaxID=3160864 RepID=A0ABV1M5A9_9NEIS
MTVISVWLDVPLRGAFAYLHGRPLESGQRVLVSFGNRQLCGVVDNTVIPDDIAPERLKPILQVFDALPPLPDSLLQQVRFAARYYLHPQGQTLFTALPTALREPRDVRLPDRACYQLTAQGLAAPPTARSTAKLALWQALHEPQERETLRRVHVQASAYLNAGLASGDIAAVPWQAPALQIDGELTLNEEQQQALDAVAAKLACFAPFLLHGITGSGKTEVYLQLIARVLAAGRQVLVVIPEINLTPQLIDRFARRFPATRIVCLHSNLADGERLEGWCDGWFGRAGIVIGTRLAVFTPLPQLGLVIVDEEHDGSFKQQDGLRYHARDLAVWRAHTANVPVLLGSATPSLETVANADAGRYRRLTLHQRAHGSATLPQVGLVDIRRQKLVEGLAAPVIDALAKALERREMSLVFINRRGYSPVLACTACGWTSACKHCSARMVLHLSARQLRCHHCGAHERIPLQCPACGNPDVQPLGEGTQRLEAALQRMLPEARILRIDRDSTSSKAAWDAIYQRVHAGEVDVLVGTQMLAKGHDFGALSLVVVLGSDGGLYSADFRAGERLFAQLMQVAGRAGRAEVPGRVLLQTQWPEHPLYQALQQHDFDGYAATMLQERREAGFPPAGFQVLLRADAPVYADAEAFLNTLLAQLGELPQGLNVFGPAPALMVRLAGRERAQLTFEADSRQALHGWLRAQLPLLEQLARKAVRGLRWSLDVDPLEM